MPKIRQYINGSGYYIRTILFPDRFYVTYQITHKGEEFLKEKGLLKDGKDIRNDILAYLRDNGLAFTAGQGLSETISSDINNNNGRKNAIALPTSSEDIDDTQFEYEGELKPRIFIVYPQNYLLYAQESSDTKQDTFLAGEKIIFALYSTEISINNYKAINISLKVDGKLKEVFKATIQQIEYAFFSFTPETPGNYIISAESMGNKYFKVVKNDYLLYNYPEQLTVRVDKRTIRSLADGSGPFDLTFAKNYENLFSEMEISCRIPVDISYTIDHHRYIIPNEKPEKVLALIKNDLQEKDLNKRLYLQIDAGNFGRIKLNIRFSLKRTFSDNVDIKTKKAREKIHWLSSRISVNNKCSNIKSIQINTKRIPKELSDYVANQPVNPLMKQGIIPHTLLYYINSVRNCLRSYYE